MILVNNPGSWRDTYAQLEHSAWDGWTFTDLVFPFFLWMVGVSMTLSFSSRAERGMARPRLILGAVRRSFLILIVAYLLNGFPTFAYAHFRIPGVLQRIAVCYLAAGLIYLFFQTWGIIGWIAALLTVYWLLMTLYPVPGFGPGVLTREGNFARYIDGAVLTGHMWSQTRTWDPEGIVSTIPAIATTLFGVLTGDFVRSSRMPAEKTSWLFTAALGLLLAGLVMSIWMPINKNLWSGSFSVFMAGMATAVFAAFYWIIDVQGHSKWVRPFIIYGSNAIAAYVLSGVLERILEYFHWARPIFQNVFLPLASAKQASLLYALANVLVIYVICWGLFRRRWFLRL